MRVTSIITLDPRLHGAHADPRLGGGGGGGGPRRRFEQRTAAARSGFRQKSHRDCGPLGGGLGGGGEEAVERWREAEQAQQLADGFDAVPLRLRHVRARLVR